jgi:hypothetical protein
MSHNQGTILVISISHKQNDRKIPPPNTDQIPRAFTGWLIRSS